MAQQQNSKSTTTTEPLAEYGLDGVDCPRCHNTGAIVTKREDGTLYARECECMAKRRSLRRIKLSNMSDMLQRYTFESYETPDDVRKKIKAKALAFCQQQDGWFYIAGKSGSGKSHICTAICASLMEQDKEVYYMAWRDESTAIKACVTDAAEYERRVNKLKRVAVLYIDDFLKGGDSSADIRLAFEILNARYIDSKLRTIISSEHDISEIISKDEALGGRIYERSRGYILKAPGENWRLRS